MKLSKEIGYNPKLNETMDYAKGLGDDSEDTTGDVSGVDADSGLFGGGQRANFCHYHTDADAHPAAHARPVHRNVHRVAYRAPGQRHALTDGHRVPDNPDSDPVRPDSDPVRPDN